MKSLSRLPVVVVHALTFQTFAGGTGPGTGAGVVAVTGAGVGATGAAVAVTPFVLSMSPSERAKNAGAPVQYDFAKIQDGQMVKVEWRGKPVVILKRTPEMMAGLDIIKDQLADI